ncbi:MAG TPA: hypothetical protein VD788_03980, partial [Candidatus Polarisedimenticolaceae bacterium]|nr:hypothetical protein [Candidatus Polarisedimenticolaceae bacterium]
MKLRCGCLFLAIGLLWTAAVPAGDDTLAFADGGSSGGGAVPAIRAGIDVEKTLLEESLARYRADASRRTALLGRIVELYAELDRVVGAPEEDAPRSVETLLDQIATAEGERSRLLLSEHALVRAIGTHVRRIALLEEQLVVLEGQREQAAGALAGEWDVVLLPLEQRGTFRLMQSGTLISGTYELAGG